MMNATALPTAKFGDYTFVFRCAVLIATEGLGVRPSQKAKLMPSKAKPTPAAPFRRRSQRFDPAMKAGIGATACSVLILALVLLAMHTLPVSIG